MPSLAAARTANAAFKFTANPVNAVFVGGTSGIGHGMASALARATKGNARIVIVGRNQAAAKELIASFPSPANTLSSFVPCDVTLMRNVHAAAKDIQLQLPTINYLVISAGFFSLNGRTETEEGIDRKLAAHYYARWTFINDLLPQVKAAQEKGEEAKVMSVFSAGHGGPIDVDDLGLKRTYSLKNAADQGTTYNDLALEEFASRNPTISFSHIYPGGVRTGIIKNSNSYLIKAASYALYPLAYLASVPEEVCADYMTYALLLAKPGFSRFDNHGDDIGRKNYDGTEEQRKKLWEHTVEETRSEPTC
ncbi:NAD(P)-binding protein [Schizophyllum commune Tattone D]|nr:NAD(P)-binding protein [Schizophyllum commune Tattone D]